MSINRTPERNSRPLLVVHQTRPEAQGVILLELRANDGSDLASFTAGSHIEVDIPGMSGESLLRQYSLCNDPSERHRYVLGVRREDNSRGGSKYLHDRVSEGTLLSTSEPRNNFPLHEDASHSILIAGGIGITPLLAMARRLTAIGRKWTLYYCVRTPAHAALLGELLALRGGDVIPVYDGVAGLSSLNLKAVVEAAPEGTHFYCCGPQGLMQAYASATASLDPSMVHIEWFSPPVRQHEESKQADDSFELRLARSGLTLQVGAEESILQVLRRADVEVPVACEAGVCGTCAVAVLEGKPDHRDYVLTPEEIARGDRMMVCVSRCAGKMLTIDL